MSTKVDVKRNMRRLLSKLLMVAMVLMTMAGCGSAEKKPVIFTGVWKALVSPRRRFS